MKKFTLFFGCLLSVAACTSSDKNLQKTETTAPAAETTPATPASTDATSQAVIVGTITANQEVITFESLLQNPEQYNNKEILLSAKINAVCQKMGCWVKLEGNTPGGQHIRVSFTDHDNMTAPKDCVGKTGIVQGVFSIKELSVAEAQHFADDEAEAGAEKKTIAAPQKEFGILASGLKIVGEKSL